MDHVTFKQEHKVDEKNRYGPKAIRRKALWSCLEYKEEYNYWR